MGIDRSIRPAAPGPAIWYDANGYNWGYTNSDGSTGPSEARRDAPRGWNPTTGQLGALLALVALVVVVLSTLLAHGANPGAQAHTHTGDAVLPHTYGVPCGDPTAPSAGSLPVVR